MHEYLNYLCIEISVLFFNSFTLKVKTKFFFMYVMVQRKLLTPSTENLVNAVLFPQSGNCKYIYTGFGNRLGHTIKNPPIRYRDHPSLL